MVKTSDLPLLVGEQVIVEMHSSGGDGDTIELEGLLQAADLQAGLVLQTREGSIIIPAIDLVDVYKASAPKKIVRRRIRYIPEPQAKQHLLDRHGMEWDLIKMLSPKRAHDVHNAFSHNNLGHRHQPRETEGTDGHTGNK